MEIKISPKVQEKISKIKCYARFVADSLDDFKKSDEQHKLYYYNIEQCNGCDDCSQEQRYKWILTISKDYNLIRVY